MVGIKESLHKYSFAGITNTDGTAAQSDNSSIPTNPAISLSFPNSSRVCTTASASTIPQSRRQPSTRPTRLRSRPALLQQSPRTIFFSAYRHREKTLHTLNMLDDESKRRGTLSQLNRGEGSHSLGRAVFHGKRGELRPSAFRRLYRLTIHDDNGWTRCPASLCSNEGHRSLLKPCPHACVLPAPEVMINRAPHRTAAIGSQFAANKRSHSRPLEISVVRGRPPGNAPGSKGAMSSQAEFDSSVAYGPFGISFSLPEPMPKLLKHPLNPCSRRNSFTKDLAQLR